MIEKLGPYSNYKESAYPWLGQIPSHWNTPRTKSCFRLRTELSGTAHGKDLLSVYTHIGVRPRKDLEERGNKASSTDNYWAVYRGDIVCNKLLAWMGAIGVSQFEGVTSPAYDILQRTKALIPEYYHELFRTRLYLSQFKANSRGIMDMRLRLYFDQFGQIPIIEPPIAEQSAIVQFLAALDRRVNRLIRAKRRLIELLAEQKQAIIAHAVTRGLNSVAKIKSSGIDWLGDVPENWVVSPLRRLGHFFKGFGGTKEDDVSAGVPCIRYGHLYMYFDFLIPESRTFITPEKANEYATVRRGDVLFAASGEDMNEIGKSAVNLMDEARCGGDVIVFRPDIDVHPEFLGYATDCWYAATQKARLGRGTTIKHIYESQLKEVYVVLPPKDVQEHIAKHISNVTTDLDRVSTDAHREIDLIREYRTRLVTDVVTGKFDVRAAAERLPGGENVPEVIESDAIADEGGEDNMSDEAAVAEEFET